MPTMMRLQLPWQRSICVSFCCLFLLVPLDVASAQSGDKAVDLEARRLFLEERLEAGKRPAQLWQYGWTGFMAVSSTVSAALAIDGDDKTVNTVNAAKSLGSLVLLFLDPLNARLGAQPMGDPDTTPAAEQVALGEAALLANAERARTRTGLRRHLMVLGANLIGGGIIWAGADLEDALISTATGLAIGEAQIWTEPTRAIDNQRAYNDRFGTDLGWSIRPAMNGVGLVYRF